MPVFLVAFLLLSIPAAAQSPIPMVLLPEQQVAERSVRPFDAGSPSAIATDFESNPVVVAISSTDAAIAYQRIARELQYGNANRIFVKILVAGDSPRRRRAVGISH